MANVKVVQTYKYEVLCTFILSGLDVFEKGATFSPTFFFICI